MKSNSLFGKKYLDLQQRQMEIGLPDDDCVIVKVHACGVCGTDINFVKDWQGDPMPLGHEIAGEVMETGRKVMNVRAGDRVIVEDCTMCGTCVDCKSGAPQYCRNMYNLENQPGMGQYLSVRYNCLNKFDGMDYVTASLTEPLAVSLAAVKSADIPLGGSVVVLGPGPVGLMAAKLARFRGAAFVAVTGLTAGNPREKARFDLAKEFGCDLIIETGSENIESVIKKHFPQGVDRVIVTSPPQSISDALKIIRFGGIITFLGLHFGGGNIVAIDINDLIFRKITLKPVFAEPAIDFPTAIKLLKSVADLQKLVTHTFGFSEAKTIMRNIIEGTEPIIKAVILPHLT